MRQKDPTPTIVLPMLAQSEYKAQLHSLHKELVSLQRHIIGHGLKVLIILEGRDAAGKDGSIKRIVKHLSPRETRVVALGKPSWSDEHTWYFRRYVAQLPYAGELVLFNRSWYNRAGVESVMGFCSHKDYEEFMQTVPLFEEMLVNSGVVLLKYYLDISQEEQKRRLDDRKSNPLKQWKTSPVDSVAIKHWADYSNARDKMLTRTHTGVAPWYVIRTDDKYSARLNLIRHILTRLDYKGRPNHLTPVDSRVAFAFSQECIVQKLLMQ
jgi:polyphosphate kinase